MLTGPLTQAMSSSLAPAHARAKYMAAYSAVNDIRDAAGPALGTGLYAASSGLPWLVAVPVTLAATLALARVAREPGPSLPTDRTLPFPGDMTDANR